MAVYLIGQLRVTNWKWYKQYQAITEDLVAKHGGRYIVKSVQLECLEGAGTPPSAVVVIEFPSKQHAEQWYGDPEYQPMIELRNVHNVDAELLLASETSSQVG